MRIRITNLKLVPKKIPGGPELPPRGFIVVDSSAVQLRRVRADRELRVEELPPPPVKPERRRRARTSAGKAETSNVSSLASPVDGVDSNGD